MKREFEKKLYQSIQVDIKSFFQNNDNISRNYENCIEYLNEIIDVIKEYSSNELLAKLYLEKDYYQNNYSYYKAIK